MPLPFTVALLLGIMLVRLLRRDLDPANRWLAVMIAAYAAQAVILGARWGYGVDSLRPAQAILAACLPPLSWLGFSGLAGPVRNIHWHVLPPVLIGLCWLFTPLLVDVGLPALFVAYGAALLSLARRGPDALARVALAGAIPALRAMRVTGAMLIASAAVDLAISFALDSGHGGRARLIAGLASLASVTILGWAAIAAGDNAPRAAPAEAAATAPDLATSDSRDTAEVSAEDAAIVSNLDILMRDRALYRDASLTLDRLARRFGLPARRLSGAINRARGINVSQYVNAHRVDDARRRLTDPAASIMQILLDVGFQTKSNFNREVLRVTGMSPSDWRREASGEADAVTGRRP